MPGRVTHFQTSVDGMSDGSDSYRYGFNGKENDFEPKNGQGSQQDYGMRVYDPRLGKFLSVDPLTSKYSMLTPYQFASNTPIKAIDLDGLEAAAPPSPNYVFIEGARQYLDAFVNFFTFDFEFEVGGTADYDSYKVGTTTITKSTVISNTTEVGYSGWEIFNPKAYASPTDYPAPMITMTNATEVIKVVEAKSAYGPAETTTKSETSSSGEKTETTTQKFGGTTNSGTPVSVSHTETSSNKNGTSETYQGTVGGENANVFLKYKSTTKEGQTTKKTTVGVEVKAETPKVNNWSFYVRSSLEVGVNQ